MIWMIYSRFTWRMEYVLYSVFIWYVKYICIVCMPIFVIPYLFVLDQKWHDTNVQTNKTPSNLLVSISVIHKKIEVRIIWMMRKPYNLMFDLNANLHCWFRCKLHGSLSALRCVAIKYHNNYSLPALLNVMIHICYIDEKCICGH